MLTPRELNVMSTASVLLRAKCGFPDGLYTSRNIGLGGLADNTPNGHLLRNRCRCRRTNMYLPLFHLGWQRYNICGPSLKCNSFTRDYLDPETILNHVLSKRILIFRNIK